MMMMMKKNKLIFIDLKTKMYLWNLLYILLDTKLLMIHFNDIFTIYILHDRCYDQIECMVLLFILCVMCVFVTFIRCNKITAEKKPLLASSGKSLHSEKYNNNNK